MRDLQQYAQDQFSQVVVESCKGFMDASEVVDVIEQMEPEFDGVSYCPSHSQQVDVIADYEREFGDDAESILDGGETFKASDWQRAQTVYAYAIAYCGCNSYFQTAKDELIDAINDFTAAMQSELETDSKIIRLSDACTHGWARHDRELAV